MELLLGLVLLLIPLSIALSMDISWLANPIGIVRKLRVMALARWAIRSIWRGLGMLLRLSLQGRRPRIRRIASGSRIGSSR